jgi:hypothetical protein
MITFQNVEVEKVSTPQGGKAKYILNGTEYFAEEVAINHYKSLGYEALWTENTYWWMLMSLLFWDVIFAKVRGAVIVSAGGVQVEVSPDEENFEDLFQQTIRLNGIPNDFFTPEFYERRKDLIRNKLQELLNSNIEQKLIESYRQNYGRYCRPIENWDKFKLEDLLIAVRKVEKEKLLKILERLITDFTNNRAGMADLIVNNDKDFFFAEVKSESDNISERQKEWHEFLSTVLHFRVEIFLINHTENQVKRIEKSYTPPSKEVIVSFGFSSSSKREEALQFIKDQESYFTQGEAKDQIYGAKFKISEDGIEKLYKILDLTSGWKTQRIEVEGEIVKSTELRDSLWCFREKVKQETSSDYCRIGLNGKFNKFGCKSINFWEFEEERWQNYGYVDTTSGEWVFNKNKIKEKLESELNRLKYCPLLDPRKALVLFEEVPEKVNPKVDREWAFISNDFDDWFWHENRWVSTFGKTNFPGFSTMIGVRKLTKKEIKEASYLLDSKDSFKSPSQKNPPKKSQKSGCFIATAVYGCSDAYQVNVLRNYRDNQLEEHVLGRLFVKIYYIASPPIAECLKRHKTLSSVIRSFLDKIVIMLERNNIYSTKDIK